MLTFSITYLFVRKNIYYEGEDDLKIGDISESSHVAALAVFASWANFTLLLGKLPASGIYINMIVGTSKDVLKFLFLYSTRLDISVFSSVF
jgi:hypothetical protein